MSINCIRLVALCFMINCVAVHAGTADIQPVVIDYFYEPGCPDCNRVRDQVMPELKERFEGFYVINRHDIGIKSNVIMLVTYQKKLGITEDKPVCMVVDYIHVLNGFDAIKKGLFQKVDAQTTARMDPAWKAPQPILVDYANTGILNERLKSFTLAMVISAGLLDGINPCAIATLVFFMSLLGVARVRGAGLLIMGFFFCLATFLTYTALGFGLLRTLHLLTGFETVRFGVELAMMVLLGVFAYLSFRDAYRYNRGGKPGDLSLQLPEGIKARIHDVMRMGTGDQDSVGRGENGSERPTSNVQQPTSNGENRYKGRIAIWTRLAVGGFVIGAAVTALESVCTGQVYVPTLVMVAREGGELSGTALRYLLLYNAMFLVPLVTVFVLTFCGLRTTTLIEWSKRNVVVSKLLLGVFFLAMAAAIAVL